MTLSVMGTSGMKYKQLQGSYGSSAGSISPAPRGRKGNAASGMTVDRALQVRRAGIRPANVPLAARVAARLAVGSMQEGTSNNPSAPAQVGGQRHPLTYAPRGLGALHP